MQPSVCVSVFFLADATHPLGTPGPAGAGPRQGSLECCIPWGCKELDMT